VQLSAENTAVVIDSTADFPEASERFPNWRVVPLYVRFGDESMRDYVEIKPSEFYGRLREAETPPTTSQPTPGDFLEVYEELAGYERILSLHVSAKLSGTYESAGMAAGQAGGDRVRIFDTKTASAGIALLALAVQRRLERGTTDEEIDALVERYLAESHLLFTVDTLEFLRRGGRIGKASAMLGSLLHVKPILSVDDGEILPIKKVRGSQKAFAEFKGRFVDESIDSPDLRVAIAHADAPDRAQALAEMVAAERPRAEIELSTGLGAVVGTHAGPGAVGFFWFHDPA
jgi:DegV family protein with EDD domain